MKFAYKLFSVIAALAITTVSSCKKEDNHNDDHDNNNTTGSVELMIDNRVKTEDLVLDTKWYTNHLGDSFQISKFNYYVTNIKLIGGSNYAEPESYHLVEESKSSSQVFTIKNIPNGTYTGISFMIGVDSLRNVSGAQTGALDASNGMFWSWNSGYIQLKMEGKAPKSTATDKMLKFHIGGFSGANSTVKTVSLNFPQAITISGSSYHVHMEANAAKMFGMPNAVDFSTTNTVHMPGATAVKIAENYAGMFSVKEVSVHTH
ncbi:hypothetical protein CAP35_04050 [Chitinophagaceae bacterium IBVUCB1]|nr:hypothetical protein CAP35_04050 [Chitinophagaceae bacterium IBVUCB1]